MLNSVAHLYELHETGKNNNSNFHSLYGLIQKEPNLKDLRNLFSEKIKDHIHNISSQSQPFFSDNCEDPKSQESLIQESKSWCLIQREKSYISMHTHYNTAYTCVYYSKVSRELSPPQGYLEVMDPSLFNSFGRTKSESFHIQPKEGRLIILPGYIPHCVCPIFDFNYERISWVMDFVITEQF